MRRRQQGIHDDEKQKDAAPNDGNDAEKRRRLQRGDIVFPPTTIYERAQTIAHIPTILRRDYAG